MSLKSVKTLGAAFAGGVALVASVSTLAGISTTKHNLGSTGTQATATYSGTDEICVFCHTPHGSDSSAPVPLWNRTLNTTPTTTYSTYADLGTSSLDSAQAAVGSVSLACLSCHDGTQAMSAILNEPGSGTNVAAYDAGSWSSGTGTMDAAGYGIRYIGTNLKDDHPVGIEYAGGYKDGSGNSGAWPDSDTRVTSSNFRDPDFNSVNSTDNGSVRSWWVDTEASPDGLRSKTDMQLYTRNGATADNGTAPTYWAGNDTPFVECASCHDPHTSTTTFLRISGGNTESQVCLACHNK